MKLISKQYLFLLIVALTNSLLASSQDEKRSTLNKISWGFGISGSLLLLANFAKKYVSPQPVSQKLANFAEKCPSLKFFAVSTEKRENLLIAGSGLLGLGALGYGIDKFFMKKKSPIVPKLEYYPVRPEDNFPPLPKGVILDTTEKGPFTIATYDEYSQKVDKTSTAALKWSEDEAKDNEAEKTLRLNFLKARKNYNENGYVLGNQEQ